MSALTKIGSALRGLVSFGQTRPLDPRRGLGYWPSIPYIPYDQKLSPRQSLEVSTVWACVMLISRSIASSPWNVFQIENETREKLPNDTLTYLLNQRPNPDTTAQRFKTGLIAQALIFPGGSYAEIERDNAGRVIALWPLLSERMLPPTRDENMNLVYEYVDLDGGRKFLTPEEVLHFAGPSVDGLMGLSTVSAAAKTIALSHATETFATSWFSNGAAPSGVIEVDHPLKKEDREDLRAEVDATYGGARKSGRPFLLGKGMKWNSLSANANEAQLNEARQLNKQILAEWFGVPLHLLADPKGSQGYGANIGALGIQFCRYGLTPWCKDLEQEVNYKCIPGRVSKVTEIDLSHLQRGNEVECAQADEIRVRSGVLAPNEARERAGMNHGPAELDRYFLPNTFATVDTIVNPPEPPALGKAPGDGKAPSDGKAPDESQQKEGDLGELANVAITKALTFGLSAHARRWKGREKDLRTHCTNGTLAAKLDASREELRARLAQDIGALAAARKLDLATLAAAVENGTEPEEALS